MEGKNPGYFALCAPEEIVLWMWERSGGAESRGGDEKETGRA